MQALRRAVSCITRSNLLFKPGGPSGEASERGVYLANAPVSLQMLDRSRPRLALRLAQSFDVVQERAAGPWRIQLVSYDYALDVVDGHELLAFHWHPSPRLPITSPHLHLGAASGLTFTALQSAHIPTGPAPLAEVLRFAIRDLGVRPIRQDWSVLLDILFVEFEKMSR